MKQRRLRGFIRPPSSSQIREISDWLHLDLSGAEVDEYRRIVTEALSACDRIDELAEETPQLNRPLVSGYRAVPGEDPLNIFITKCNIMGSGDGPLLGKRVAVKDNIAVAGLPWTGGNQALTDVVPDFDAVVVERLLAAGANLVGKLNQDDYSFAGSSDTSGFGATRNPLNPDYSPGGSSSGEGAAIRAGYADITLGVDQAGSGRIPAAWTGTCAIKPTHGLVPTFGIHYLDHTIDYICPCAKTIEELAIALEVIAGPDDRDPQWTSNRELPERYSANLQVDPRTLTVGILRDGFGRNSKNPDNDRAVFEALDTLRDAGVSIKEVSVPLWDESWAIYAGVFSASMSVMFESNGQGFFHNGATMPLLAAAFGERRRQWGHEYPPLLNMFLLMGVFLRREHNNVYYSKAQNLRRVLARQVDEALGEIDVLALPSTTNPPSRLLERPLALSEWVEFAINVSGTGLVNTLGTDLTGHPALVMPCGIGGENLPYSIQFIGRRWNETTVLRVASLYQRLTPHLAQQLDQIASEVMARISEA